jgi:peptidoglycan hydrolase-like protein with peptidoglycan-binding domain
MWAVFSRVAIHYHVTLQMLFCIGMKHFYLLAFILLLYSFTTTNVSALTCTTLTKSFSRRSEGEHVLLLQYFLTDTGHLLVTPNGYFGPATLAAVKRFQVSVGLPPVGTVGPMTRKKIKDISCVTKVIEDQVIVTSSLVNVATTTNATTTENVTKNATSTPTATTSQLVAPVAVQMIDDRENALIRNAKRQSDIANLHVALGKFIEDNNLVLPYGITSRPTELCSTTGYTCSGKVDLGVSLSRYIPQLPKDPKATGTNGTGYFISKNANDVITISAPYAEEGQVIMMSR